MRFGALIFAGLSFAGLSFAGCETERGEPSVQVRIAPLTIVGVTEAVWRLAVHGPSGALVWQHTVTSSAFGDGAGFVSFVGPCDASDGGGNTVTLELLELVPLAATDWVNPGPMTRAFACSENADSLVMFDVTVLGKAGVGFVDYTVNFEHIGCSAKYDCLDESGAPIELVPNAQGVRESSGVLAVACTSGPSVDLRMYTTDAAITCQSGETYALAPVPEGLSWPAANAPANVLIAGQLNSWGTVADSSSRGVYVSIATAFGPNAADLGAHRDCRLRFRATATTAPLVGLTIAPATTYPVIDWDVPLTDEDGLPACGAYALFEGPEISGLYATGGDVFSHVFAQSPGP